MKKFRMTHMLGNITEFSEKDPPEWLISDEYYWWWYDYVLKLDIGETAEGDFQIITRIE